MELETKRSKILWELIKLAWKPSLPVIAILLTIVTYFGFELSKIQLVFLFVLLLILVTLLGSMIYLAIKEIKEKNEQITPPLSKSFEKLPEDLILENHEELYDIENLNGDYNFTLKQELVSLSNSKIEQWYHTVSSSNLQGNPINLKAYKIGSNEKVVPDPPLKVESLRKGKDSQNFLIDFITTKSPNIAFIIKYSLNRIFPAMLTSGEHVSTIFPRQVKKYKIEIKLPKEIQKIERCCITKKARGGGVIENGCYSGNSGKPVPIQETCYPHNQLNREIDIDNKEGRYKMVLESESGLNKEDSVTIWWLCS